MRGAKKKYVYIEVAKGKYLKARVALEGREEPSITASTDPSKVVVLWKPVRRVARGYKVFKLEDLPEKLKEEIRAKLSAH